MSPTRSKPSRKDAVSNRRRVLRAAEGLLAEHGLDVSISAIADAAGVGVGTVYRGFGSKADLVSALYADKVDQAGELIKQHADNASSWDALASTIRALAVLSAENRALYQIIFRVEAGAGSMLRDEIAPLLRKIIDRARADGSVRPDFSATDIPVFAHLIGAVAAPATHASERVMWRVTELLLKGIRPTADVDPIVPPFTDDEVVEWMGVAFGRRSGRA